MRTGESIIIHLFAFLLPLFAVLYAVLFIERIFTFISSKRHKFDHLFEKRDEP